jgi:hypothetical protein
MEEQVEVITSDEIETLLLATIQGQGEATEEELRRVHKWAHTARIDGALLELVLAGKLLVSARDSETNLSFKKVANG